MWARRAGVSLAMATSLFFTTACGAGEKGANDAVSAGDYAVAARENVVDSIVVDGTVEPVRTAAISSTLTVPVGTVHVQVGDRVKQGQLLVTMDTSSIERQLNASGEPITMTAAAGQVERAVQDAGEAIHDSISSIFPQGAPPPPPPAPATAPGPSREEIEQALVEAHEQGRVEGQNEAQAAVEEQLGTQQGMPPGMGEDTSSLEYQMEEREIFAPMDGVVTKIEAQEGAPATGALLTIADASRLLVKANVRETDVARVKEGNRVEFTTPVTGDKKIEGRVRKIAPMAEESDPAARAMQQGQGQGQSKDSGILFPVEIEVVGDMNDLRLGGSARAEIITDETQDALSIPRDAVYGDGKVLVLVPEEDSTATVEERTVKTGVKNDTDIAVTGGDLKEGDMVVAWPDDYKDKVGETVQIADESFGQDKNDKKD